MNSSDGYLTRSTLEFQRPVPGTGAEINLHSSQETALTNDLFHIELCFFKPQHIKCNNLQDCLSNLVHVSPSSNRRNLQRTKALISRFKNNIYLADSFTDNYNQKILRSRQERELLLKITEFELEAIKEERLAMEKQMALKLENENLGLDRRISEPTMNDKPMEENADQEIRSIPELIIDEQHQDNVACESASNVIQMEEATQDLNEPQEDELVKPLSGYIQMEQTKDLQFLVNESPQELVFVSNNDQMEMENIRQTNSSKEQYQSSDKELVNSVHKIDQATSNENLKEKKNSGHFSSDWLRNEIENARNSIQSVVHDIENEKNDKETIMLWQSVSNEEENKDQQHPTNSKIDSTSDESISDIIKNVMKNIDFSTIKSPNNANSRECVKEVVKNKEKDEPRRKRKKYLIKEAATPLKDRFGNRNERLTLTESHLKWLNMSIKSKNEYPPLTKEMMHRYNDLMIGRPDEEIISKFRLHIKRESIRTLSGSNWLDDEVVNFYMNLITQRSEMKNQLPSVYCMNTFFLPIFITNGYAAVKRWTSKIDIFTKDIIVVPVYTDTSHWCAAIIHMRQQTLRCYDSLGQLRTQVLDALKLYLKQESLDKHKKLFDTNTLSINNASDAPKQRNSNDCGVFSCMVAEYITRDQPLTFTQRNIPYLRVKMALEISEGRLWL
ncbi:uncharacterized protein [Drosophila tropicalis]